jgi:hypothetical protein
VEDLAKKRANPIAPELRADILQFYSNPNAPLATKKKKKDWQKLQQNLAKLQEQKPEATPRPSPQ